MTETNATSSAVTIRDLQWQWPDSTASLAFPDMDLERGQHLFLKGPSGSGKSTLLSLLAGLLSTRQGTLRVLGHDLTRCSGGQRDRIRARELGVIFQQFNLVPYLSCRDNVLLPCRLSPQRWQAAGPDPAATATNLLDALGLTRALWSRPVTRLSVGQQQRVAAARALIGKPSLILADEPTSALDADNRDRFIELLLTQARRCGAAVIFVSHDASLARHFGHYLELEVAL